MAKLLGCITSPTDVITQISHMGHSICSNQDELQQSQQNSAAMWDEKWGCCLHPSALLEHWNAPRRRHFLRGEEVRGKSSVKHGAVHISGVWTHCLSCRNHFRQIVTCWIWRGFFSYTLTLWRWKGVRAMVWPLPAPPASAVFPSCAFLLSLAKESTARSIIPVTGRRS